MRVLLTLLLLVLSTSIFAQTTETEKKLTEGIKLYNKLRESNGNLQTDKVSALDLTFFYLSSSEIEPLFDYVLQFGNDQEKRTARYFKANVSYELAFLLGMLGKNADAYPVMNSIKSDYEYFSFESSFPLNYTLDGQKYVINFTNFEHTLTEYYTGFAEICANLGKYQEAIVWAKKVINDKNSSDWYRYIACNKMEDSKKKLNQIDAEYIDLFVNWSISFSALDTAYRNTITKYKYASPFSMTKKLVAAVDSLPSLAKNGDQLTLYARTIKAEFVNEAA